MRILVACEFSGAVRSRLRQLGHQAWSCDLEPAEDGSPFHFQRDVNEFLNEGWDAIIAFPPCTYLCSSGARWWKLRAQEQEAALRFVNDIWNAPCPRVAIENPVGIIPRILGKATQIIQPWMFGHGETKKTCLWLRGLDPLVPTNVVEGRVQRVWRMGKCKRRSRERSRTYAGIAEAMARQWFPVDK